MRQIAGIDANTLDRLQFGFTICVHIIFPALSIGLSAFIAVLEVLWIRGRGIQYHTLARFWTKVFALTFAMGVVSGVPLTYQFGTNWSHFSQVAGNVIGPLVGYETIAAFFLEAGFLGIMLMGWNRVSPRTHVFASIMVAFGTCLSAFWILSANSWLQTPAGYELRDGIVYPVDWVRIIFNPSFPYRLAHMLIATYITTSLVVLGVGARYLLERRFETEAKTMLQMSLFTLSCLTPIQALVGDQQGLNTARYQPAKLAAIEGHWNGDEVAPLLLFAIPETGQERNRAEVGIPRFGSLMITHRLDGRFRGLKDFPAADRPQVGRVFFAFRVMVGLGSLMIVGTAVGSFLWWRGTLFQTRWYLRLLRWSWPGGFVALLCGWIVTETGRQPWLIQGILRTAQASSTVATTAVATSFCLFLVIYVIVFSTGLRYIRRVLLQGPTAVAPATVLPNRPLSAALLSARTSRGVNP